MLKTLSGKHGESVAEELLITCGCTIVDKNWYCRYGEIDIIAVKVHVYHFVEVKTRLSSEYGSAVESLTSSKIKNLLRSVNSYTKAKKLSDIPISIDLIAIDIDGDGVINSEWIKNITT